MEKGDGRVRVFARVRPTNSQEGCRGPAVDVSGCNSVRVSSPTGDGNEARDFTFDGVFPASASQQDVFAEAGLPVLQDCMRGINGTIFAYGQTGSGKTHSLLHVGQKTEEAGLLPRLVASLYSQVASDASSVYEVRAAALQVYNEQVDDLLHPEHQTGVGQNLAVQNGGVVPGLTWLPCEEPGQMLEAFSRARANVVYAETKMNKASSRSHAIFQVRILRRSWVHAEDGDLGGSRRVECTRSRLSVVDLAGSERVKKSGVEGAQFKEATAINRSLLSLGNVVSALAAKKSHIPMRDSKLTRILDGSVGGTCRTVLLVCASPALENAQETLSTFEFASRAMRVEVHARVNTCIVEFDAKSLLKELNAETPEPPNALIQELHALKRERSEAAECNEFEAKRREEVKAEVIAESRRWQEAAIQQEHGRRAAEEEATLLLQELGTARASMCEWRTKAEAWSEATHAAKVAACAAEAHSSRAEDRTALAERSAILAEEASAAAEQANLDWRQQAAAAGAALDAARRAAEEQRAEVEAEWRAADARAAAAARDAAAARHEATMEAKARAADQQQELTKLLNKSTVLEIELTALSEELEDRDEALAEAARAEEQRAAETAEREANFLREVVEAREASERLQEEIAASTRRDAEAARMRSRREAEAERSRAAEQARHEAAAEAHRADVQARLQASEAQLLEHKKKIKVERCQMRKKMEQQRGELEAEFQTLREEAVAEEYERSSAQQRRVAAAFKAARGLSELREAELREAHEELAQRYAARDSRDEDKRSIAELQQQIEEQRRQVQIRDAEIKELAREMQHREMTDRIFGSAELRGTSRSGSPCGPSAALLPRPRRKAGEAAPAPTPPDRVQRRALSAQRTGDRDRSPEPIAAAARAVLLGQ